MARHRSPRGRGAHQRPPSLGSALAAGASGGGHRSAAVATSNLASRRGLLAAGGAVVVLGQAAFSQVVDPNRPLLPELGLGETFDVQETAAPSSTPVPVASESASVTSEPARGNFEPVRSVSVDELGQADVESLVKSARLTEAARAAREAARAAEAKARAEAADRPSVRGAACAPNSAGFGNVKSWVGDAGHWLRCIFNVKTVGGVAGRAGASDHPSGLALDFMVNRATGDRLAEYALKYRKELKIKYVIWRQRINYGSGWQAMEDRGSATANHFDHVHISFHR